MNVRPEWPTTQPDAETLLRYIAGRGLWLSSAMWPAMKLDDNSVTSDKIMYQMISTHDRVRHSAGDPIMSRGDHDDR